MMEELPVDLKKKRVGAENVLQLGQGFSLLSEEPGDKTFKPGSVSQRNGLEEIKLNGGIIHNFTTQKYKLPLEAVQSKKDEATIRIRTGDSSQDPFL
jgi:hypothetical protein